MFNRRDFLLTSSLLAITGCKQNERLVVDDFMTCEEYKSLADESKSTRELKWWEKLDRYEISDLICPDSVPLILSELQNQVVYIDSVGGDVNAGLQIADQIAECNMTVCNGWALGIAFLIFASGNHRVACEKSIFQLSNCTLMEFCSSLCSLKEEKNILEDMDKKLATRYSAVSKLSVDNIRQMMNQNHYLAAKEAIEYGFVDEIWKI